MPMGSNSVFVERPEFIWMEDESDEEVFGCRKRDEKYFSKLTENCQTESLPQRREDSYDILFEDCSDNEDFGWPTKETSFTRMCAIIVSAN